MAQKRTAKEREDEALQKVYDLVNADDLEAAADAIRQIRGIEEDLRILRAKVLALDGIDSPGGDDDRSIFDLAEELSNQILDSLEPLQKAAQVLDEVTLIDPTLPQDDPEEDDGDEEDEETKGE